MEGLYGNRAERSAAELSHHFLESSTLTRSHAGKAARYCRLAAEQAEAANAWDDAARHYKDCIAIVSDAEDALGEDDAALLTALGRCYRYAAEWRSAWRSLMQAIGLYRESGDGIGVARATIEAGLIEAPPERLISLVEDALDALGDADSYLKAQLLARRAWLSDDDAAVRAARRARELVKAHGFEGVEASLLFQEGYRAMNEMRHDDARSLYLGAHEKFNAAGVLVGAAEALWYAAVTTLHQGGLDEGEGVFEEALAYALRAHARLYEQTCLLGLAAVALVRCDFERFESLVAEMSGDFWLMVALRAARAEMEGQVEQAVEMAPRLDTPGGITTPATVAVPPSCPEW